MGCGGRVWGRIHIGDAARLSSMGGASGHAWSASRGSHRAPLRSTDIPSGLCLDFTFCPEPVPFHSRPGPFAPPPPTHVQDVHPGSGPAAAGRSLSDAASASSGPRRRRSRSAPASSSVSCACHGVHSQQVASMARGAPATAAERGLPSQLARLDRTPGRSRPE